MVKNPPANAGDAGHSGPSPGWGSPGEGNGAPPSPGWGSPGEGNGTPPSPGWGSPGEGNGTPLQYYCLENPRDRRAWTSAVHGIARVGHD